MYSSKVTENNANCNPTSVEYLERKLLIRSSMERMHALGFSLTPPYVKGQTKGQTERRWKIYQLKRAKLNEVKWWSTRWPGQNYGIITGAISGIVALDTDDEEAEALLRDRCPATPVRQRSGSDRGIHHIYRHPGFDVANVVKLIFRGKRYRLDIRGEGGLIVGPGCRHPETGGIYTEVETWTPELLVCAPVFDPAWLEINGQRTARPKSPDAVRSDFQDTPIDLDGLKAKQQSGRDWLAHCPGAVQGKGRGADNYAYSLAVELLWAFDLTPAEGFPLLFEWGQRESNRDSGGGYWPWTEREIRHKLNDAAAEVQEDKPRGHRLPSSCYDEQVAALFAEKQKVKIDERPPGDLADGEQTCSLNAQNAPEATQEPTSVPKPLGAAQSPRHAEDQRRRRGYRLADLKMLPSPKWLIKNHLTTNSLGAIYGAAGSGKTFYALDMGLSIASGSAFLGLYSTLKAPVLYLSGEGNAGIYKRIEAWMTHYGLDYPHDFVTVPFQFDMLVEKEIDEILTIIDLDLGKPPGLVVVDTLARYFGDGDENATKDMGKFVRLLDRLKARTGATILPVHHTGKDEAKKERGNSVLRGACDFIIATKAEPNLIVSCDKQKDAEPFDQYLCKKHIIRLGTDDEGEEITSCVFVPTDLIEQKWTLLTKTKKDFVQTMWAKVKGGWFTQGDCRAATNKSKSAVSKDLSELNHVVDRHNEQYRIKPGFYPFLRNQDSELNKGG